MAPLHLTPGDPMARLALLLLLAGCGPSPVAVCAGNHSGSFTGSDQGTLTATLDEKGKTEVTLVGQASGEISTKGKVDRDGTVETEGVVVIRGALDLDTCVSSGTWSQSLLGLSGDWEMTLEP